MNLRVVAASLLLALAGCAGLKPPEAGGQPWLQVQSRHFSLRTDLDLADAQAAVVKLEQMHAAMLRAGFGLDDAHHPRLQLVLFRNMKELRDFANDPRMGRVSYGRYATSNVQAFAASDVLGRPVFVSSRDFGIEDNEGIVNGVAMIAARPFARRLPWWLADGTASLLAQGRFDADGFRMGSLTSSAQRAMPVPVSMVRAKNRRHGSGEQPTTLLLVHHLRMERGRELADFVQRLLAGEPEERAIAAAFPGWSDGLADGVLSQMRQQLVPKVVSIPFAPYQGPLDTQPLTAAEVHAIWGELHLGLGHLGSLDKGRREVARALELDQGNVTARLFNVPKLETPEGAKAVRELQALHPDDARLAILLASANTLEPAERLEQAEKALALDPEQDKPRVARAVSLLQLKRGAEASQAILELMDRAGPSAELLRLLSAAQAMAGACGDAVASAEKAADLEEDAAEVRRSLKQAELLRQGCRDASKSKI